MLFDINESTVDNSGTLLESLDFGHSVYCFTSSSNMMYESAYESYLQNKFMNEAMLIDMLNSKLSLKMESASVMLEATGDKLKSKWNKFVEFIKGIFSRFMESMSAFFLSNKDYLEKYEKIIKEKKPKDDLKYSYTGNYKDGINRIINTELEVFDFNTYGDAIQQKGDGPLVTAIFKKANQTGFTYDEGESLASQFKTYFLGGDGKSEGDFSNLNFTDMYNFCHNFDQIEKIQKKDLEHLNKSTQAIDATIKDQIRANAKNAADAKANSAETQKSQEEIEKEAKEKSKKATEPIKKVEGNSAILYRTGKVLSEAGEGLKIQDDTDSSSGNNATSNAISQTGSYANRDQLGDEDKKAKTGDAAERAKGQDETEALKAVTAITDKWIRVCNALITAKYTACQQISRDYMDIIRAHVRSYGGKDLKDTTTNKNKDTATNYSKARNNKQNQGNDNQGGESDTETGEGGN